MGLDPNRLPERFINKVRKADRPPGVLSAAEAQEKEVRRSEAQEQSTFYNWLLLAEERGELEFDQSATHKRKTSRLGFPDFLILPDQRPAFFIEFKMPEGRLTPVQDHRFKQLTELGYKVFIARDAEEAIRIVRRELTTWNPKH
jgi:hypothetical protein